MPQSELSSVERDLIDQAAPLEYGAKIAFECAEHIYYQLKTSHRDYARTNPESIKSFDIHENTITTGEIPDTIQNKKEYVDAMGSVILGIYIKMGLVSFNQD